MAGTFKDLQDRINLDYLNRTDLQNETKRALIRAVKHYEKERFWFNMTATAIAVGSASFTCGALPSDFLALDFVTIRDTSLDTILTIRSYDRIAYQIKDPATSGVPTEICYWHDVFVMNTKPRSATSITLHYTQALATLSADADANGWTSAGEDLIVHHATADMLANVLRVGDPGQVSAHKQWEMEAYKTLVFGNRMRINPTNEDGMVGTQHGAPGKVPVLGDPFGDQGAPAMPQKK